MNIDTFALMVKVVVN